MNPQSEVSECEHPPPKAKREEMYNGIGAHSVNLPATLVMCVNISLDTIHAIVASCPSALANYRYWDVEANAGNWKRISSGAMFVRPPASLPATLRTGTTCRSGRVPLFLLLEMQR